MSRLAAWVGEHRDVLFAVALLSLLGAIVVPLPPALLDLLLVLSLTLSVLLLLVVVGVREPLALSAFPTVLLLSTAFRLAVNIATTRQILGNAAGEGTAAAGRVVEAFGLIVAGADPLIGFVIFAILLLVNFVVVTKGAGRISEVAARFALDAMPGKQMAIDADLNAGLIREAEARERRAQVAREAEFYGAMDGASKFVRGDAIAGLVITLVNLVAGVAVGWLRHGMSAAEALETYTVLTVGDGLVTQVPALVVSLAAGLLVTRGGAKGEMGRDVLGQVFGDPQALRLCAAFLGVLLAGAVVTGASLPVVQVLGVLACVALAASSIAGAKRDRERAAVARREQEAQAARPPERVEPLLHVEPLELEVGAGLVRFVDPAQGGALLERVAKIRRETAVELGLVVPPVRILDNLKLAAGEYVLRLKGQPVGGGTLRTDRVLAIDAGGVREAVEGEPAKDPVFGAPARWIRPEDAERAKAAGYQAADAAKVLETHLVETLRRHAHELLTRDEVNNLLKTLKEKAPAVVEEVVPAVLKPGEVQKVLQNLLREGVSIRDLGTILETLGDVAPRTRDPEVLTEHVRAALARTICRRHLEPDGRMYVITLDPALEDMIRAATERTERGSALALTPGTVARIAERIGREVDRLSAAGHAPVLLCAPAVRAQVRRIVETLQAEVAVLSYNEILRDVPVEAMGRVALEGVSP